MALPIYLKPFPIYRKVKIILSEYKSLREAQLQ